MTLSAYDAANLFRETPHRLIDVGHGEVAYRCVGSGPDVLFVHGWPVSGATFRCLLPYLTPNVTCHIIDMVGTGQSRFQRNPNISIDLHIKSVRSVVDALKLDNVALVGHNSGGMIARHAMVGDSRLRAMALVNTEQPQGLNWRFRQFLSMSKFPGFMNLLAWAAMKPGLRKNKFLLGDCFIDRSLLNGEFEEFFLAPLQQNLDLRWAAGQLLRSFKESYVTELHEIHNRLNVPVQLVWGEQDPFFPIAWAKEMASTFPNTRLHVLPNAKLFVHEERPEEVSQAILPTLLGDHSN